jgi:hypothetical protein
MSLKVKYFLVALITFIIEVLIATIFSDIKFIRYHLSDFFVVILIYYFVKFFYNFQPLTLSIAVFLFACGIEILQYFHIADVLRLSQDGVLRIAIGTSFSWRDFLMYFLGCSAGYFADTYFFYHPNDLKSKL